MSASSSALVFAAIANQGVAVDSLEVVVAAEVARIAREGVTAAELAKAKNGYVAGKIQQQQISYFLAEAIQEAAMFLGGPEKVNSEPARFLAVTVEDIRRVAAKYLKSTNAAVFVVTPGAAQ